MIANTAETQAEPKPARVNDDTLKSAVRAFVERIEERETEKKDIAEDVKAIYAEAKARGLDVKALKHVVSLRKQDADEVKEHEAIVDTYLSSLGMMPLFDRE